MGSPDELTPRQIEILQKVAAGMSTRETAEALHISVDEVKAELLQIFESLQTHSSLPPPDDVA